MKILIGIPMMGPIHPAVVVSLMNVAVEARLLGKVVLSYTEGLVPHDRGREAIFEDAIEAKADYVLSLDSDMLFPQGMVSTLHNALVENKAQVASGIYVRRGYPYTSVWSKKVGDTWSQVQATNGVHEIHMTGLGCALFDMNWLKDNLSKPFCKYERRYDRPDILDDESLFDAVRNAGGKIIGVGEVQCAHQLKPEFVTLSNSNSMRVREISSQ